MNLDELRTVQSKERRKDSLQHLRDSFYEDVADYVAGLKSERQEAAAAADDPFSSPEVSRLTDEIETAEEVVEAVYERRVGKVVKLASFAAADMPVDEDGMTTQERDLFDDLVARIEENKTTVLDVLAGEGGGEASAGAAASSTGSDPDPASADAGSAADRAGSSTPTGAGTAGPDSDRGSDPGTPDPSAAGQGVADPESTDGGGDDPPDVLSQAMDDDRELTVGEGTGSGPADGGNGSTGEDGTEPVADTGDATRAGGEARTPPTPPETPDESADGESPDADAGSDSGTGTGPGAEAEADADRTTVRITRDVGSILGVDQREYDLAEEDVVTLPSANADPLVERDAAERID